MSIKLMSLVWDVTWPTQSHLLVALKLADHAHNDGSSVYPAKASVARQAQCSESTVANALRALRGCGLLRVIQDGGNGPRSPTVYAFNVELLEYLAAIHAELDGCADRIEISQDTYQQALDAKGSTVDPLDHLRGQNEEAKGSKQPAKGSTALTPNHHLRTIKENLRQKDSNFDLKVKAGTPGVLLVRAFHPDELAAWRRFALHRGGIAMRRLVYMIDTHGGAAVPSQWPPDAGLSKISKRTTGDAA